MASLAGAEADAGAWFDLGRASLELGRFGEAVGALAKAVVHGAGPPAEADLAMLHALRGEPLRAMAELRDVLRRHPDFADARVRLAWLMLADGGEAEVLELLAGQGDLSWRAARSFALLRSGQLEAARAAIGPDATQERTLTLVLQLLRLALAGDPAAVPALTLEVASLAGDARRARPDRRVDAHFQLGALYASDQPDLAFRHWRYGHEILGRAQPFSRRNHAALLQATVAAWGPDRFEDAHGAPGPVFIVGLPRSGTTLAEHILSAHPQVFGAGERMEVLEAAGRLGGPVLDPESSGRAARAGREALAVEAARYRAALRAGVPARVSRVVDKMPANDLQLGLIAAMLPGARVIHCRRDLRATGLSIYRRHLSGHHPYAHDLGDLGWWMTAQRGLMEHWRSTPLPILDLELEDWRRDFRATLARVLGFLELPYHPACERFHLQDRVVRTASRDQVRRPVEAGDDWRPYEAWLEPMIAELPPAMGL